MRRVGINSVKPSSVLARGIYGSHGTVLLAKGTSLKSSYIRRLKQLGVSSLYIEDERLKDIEVPAVISDHLYRSTVKLVEEVFSGRRVGIVISTEAIRKKIEEIVDEIIQNKTFTADFLNIRLSRKHLFYHSVDVAVLSLIMGVILGYSRAELIELGVGALLHDIGMINLPGEVLDKEGKLGDEEFEEVKRHPRDGWAMLEESEGISALSSRVAYEHHEHLDGSGYPRGISGCEMGEYSRIVSIVEYYDGLLFFRPYSKELLLPYPALPHQGIEIVVGLGEKWFDIKMVEVFSRSIAVYPVGSTVKLNAGGKGFVIGLNADYPNRPIVRIVEDADGNELSPPIDVDLAHAPTLRISEVLEF